MGPNKSWCYQSLVYLCFQSTASQFKQNLRVYHSWVLFSITVHHLQDNAWLCSILHTGITLTPINSKPTNSNSSTVLPFRKALSLDMQKAVLHSLQLLIWLNLDNNMLSIVLRCKVSPNHWVYGFWQYYYRDAILLCFTIDLGWFYDYRNAFTTISFSIRALVYSFGI